MSLNAVNAGIFAGGSVTAGEYAGVITWGTAAGPMTVNGPEGAFGWSYGDFNGFVESSGGSASLSSYGNAIGVVRGATCTSLLAVGYRACSIFVGASGMLIYDRRRRRQEQR